MESNSERRENPRIRMRMTALVRPSRRRGAILLRVMNLATGGALCRTPVPLRLGATLEAEFMVEGKWTGERPRVLRAYCRVVWAASRIGPTRPIQEVGLSFLELSADQRAALEGLLAAQAAA